MAAKSGVGRGGFSVFGEEERNSLIKDENSLVKSCRQKKVTHIEYNALLKFWHDKQVRMLDLIALRLA